MPPRYAIGEAEEAMLLEALAHYRAAGVDPGYQGHYEQRYCNAFAELQGGGYADAVATGTAALFIAIAALELPARSEVLVSPITDPGTMSAIIMNGLVPRLLDSRPDNFNVGPEQVLERLTDSTSCIVLVHSIGQAADVSAICTLAAERGIAVLEDCSQSHGARHNGARIGTFGEIAAFSTMYRKASITGASGGVVYTRDEDLYHMALAHADRGKPSWREGFDDRNPSQFLFPALNLHTDELSCAIGLASIGRLDSVIEARLAFVRQVSEGVDRESSACRGYGYGEDDSPFIYPVIVEPERLVCSKTEFAEAVRAEGIGLNPHYQYLAADWPYFEPYCADRFDCPNARSIRDRCFCLYLNEKYSVRESADTLEAILKVERHFAAG